MTGQRYMDRTISCQNELSLLGGSDPQQPVPLHLQTSDLISQVKDRRVSLYDQQARPVPSVDEALDAAIVGIREFGERLLGLGRNLDRVRREERE